MLYSLFVMIGDGKRSFWCGTEGKYMKKKCRPRVSCLDFHVSRVFILVPPQVFGGARVKAAAPVR